ncbi:MAG: hypothetical protein KME26_10650 [Oscillatoria princeps RMCB-10]|jgi:hypothetical protein|nr:hypothetical protein [Oscillatoria princeps RMCB-10]
MIVFDLHTLSELSRTHCIAICAFLVPANLLVTLLTIILTALRRPQVQVWRAAGFAGILAAVMVFHVYTWLSVGVIMAPTYILLSLASTCLAINLWASTHPRSMARLLRGA